MRPSRIIREFRELAEAVHNNPGLARLIEEVGLELGFEFVAALHSSTLAHDSAGLFRFDNYPIGWDRRLVIRGQKIIDPVLRHARRRASGFLWSDVLVRAQLSRPERAIIEAGDRFGIRQGFTVPANVPGEPAGSVSFATRSLRPIGRERQLIVDAIGRIAFDSARRLTGLGIGIVNEPHVGDRARECIFWIAHGKTDQDIADILGVALETVRTNVKIAFRRLNVITRGQLVQEALKHGIIDFEPTIPPYG